MKDITKINRTFSRRHVTTAPKGENLSRQETAYRSQASSVQMSAGSVSSVPVTSTTTDFTISDTVYAEVAATASIPVAAAGSSMEKTSSYTAELGALEMRVAKGDLTFLPPMVMTIVTQYPELHFEYLGDFNYVPPRDAQTGGNINLFT